MSLEDKRVLHAIAMKDERSVCVINQYDDLSPRTSAAAPAACAGAPAAS
jgi:hypothetical protein